MSFKISTYSSKGRRANQEDAVWNSDPGPAELLAVVADGLGGHNKGEFASETLIKHFKESFAKLRQSPSISNVMETVIRNASTEIIQKGNKESAYLDAYSTCTALFVAPNVFWIAHVGDTRCYRFRKGELQQLTTDHTIVQEMLDNNEITEEDAFTHKRRNLLTNVVGRDIFKFSVDTQGPKPLCDNDIFILTSDGIHDVLKHSEITNILLQNDNFAQLAPLLCTTAYGAGSKDNLSAIVISPINSIV